MQKKNAAGKSSGKEDSDDDAEDDFERQVVSFLQVALERPETAAARKKVIVLDDDPLAKVSGRLIEATSSGFQMLQAWIGEAALGRHRPEQPAVPPVDIVHVIEVARHAVRHDHRF